MRRPAVLAMLLAIGLAIHISAAVPARAQAGGSTVTYPAGLSLVSGPSGTDFAAAQGDLSTLQAGSRDYKSSSPAAGTTAGYGYWAQFAAPTTVQLSPGSSTAYSTSVLAGQWVLIGDPSGTLPATVNGAAAIYIYDPASGYQPATLLQPGQGAWALSAGGGMITVAPQTPEALAAAASLRTFSGNGYQISVPKDWDKVALGSRSNSDLDAVFQAPDPQQGLWLEEVQAPAGAPLNAVRFLGVFLNNPPKYVHNPQVVSPAAQMPVANADSAATMTLTYTDDKGVAYQQTLIASIRNETLYLLTADTTKDFASQNQALIQQIVQSFELTP